MRAVPSLNIMIMEQSLQSPPRRALGVLDPNKKPNAATDKPCSAIKASKPSSPQLPIKKRQGLTLQEKKSKFDKVCRERIGEDYTGELCDLGVREWAIDDFEIVRKLGSGGAATVFLAKEKQSGYEVALKVQDATENSICEIDVHMSLEHPNIVRMIDYFHSYEMVGIQDDEATSTTPKQYMCIILELCDGGDLHGAITYSSCDGSLEEQVAARFFKNALEGLEYLHEQDVIHCDIKPANFLVHKNQLKLADFGMAVRSTERDVLGGSPIYMSPEHLLAWRHMTDKFDHRADIYSLGVMLYEMLFGYLPYEVIEEGADLAENQSSDEPASSETLLNKMDALGIDSEIPVLDLRKLNDCSSDEPFYMPPPIFDDEISEEAEDLIMQLMEPSVEKRISLSEAKKHPWFEKVLK